MKIMFNYLNWSFELLNLKYEYKHKNFILYEAP
jgi:hypothetical protein